MSISFIDQDSYRVIWLVRRLFRALGQNADERLRDHGVSAADRAVMEFLYPDQTLSVPQIARKYDVSRQHVQVTVNPLIDRGLVELSENPRHKRSPLVRLTKNGRDLFKTILKGDEKALRALFADIPSSDVRVTHKTLQTLLTKTKGETEA
jgi:DNA-binding MarR family transcriptional regulator